MTAMTPEDVDRIRALTIAITAPQDEQSIGGRSLRGGLKRLGSNFSKRCSKAIRRLPLACRRPKLRARRKPLGSTCWRISQRNSAPVSERFFRLAGFSAAIAEAHPAIRAGEGVLFTDDAAVEVTTARRRRGSPPPVVNPPLSCLQHRGRIWTELDFQ